jgi:hypothetical protein
MSIQVSQAPPGPSGARRAADTAAGTIRIRTTQGDSTARPHLLRRRIDDEVRTKATQTISVP